MNEAHLGITGLRNADERPRTPASFDEHVRDAERRLRHQLVFTSAITNSIADGIYAIDGEGRLTYLNPAAERMLGWTEREIVGRDMHETIHFKHADGSAFPKEECPLMSVLVTGKTVRSNEDAFVCKDGRVVPVSYTSSPIVEEGHIVGAVVAFHDITEQKRSQEAMRRSEEDFRALFEGVGVGKGEADAASGRFLRVNQKLCQITGYDAEELLRMTPLNLTHPDDQARAVAGYAKLTRGEIDRYEVEERFVRKDGSTIWAGLVVTPRHDAALTVTRYIMAVQDVTSRRRMEETLVEQTEALRQWSEELEERVRQRTAELESANAKLRVSNRELQDFASVASHDLQEPLRKILAFGDRLESKSAEALGEEGKDYLHRMKSAAARMQALIGDLLAFSRVTTKAQPFVEVDLNEVAFEVLLDLETRIHETRAVIRFDPLPVVEADPTQMRQLFQNLIGNALKFRKADVVPQIHVRAEAVPAAPADGRAGPQCRIFVQDNGIGFDEKYLDRIFNVFQRLHARGEYEGTGIGLAVCRKIAERHGGTIAASSRPGEGSTFVVTLPALLSPKGNQA
jgi:PAS domain S-box-containing protein